MCTILLYPGFVYLRVLDVFTRPLVNNILKTDEWIAQPIASQIRTAFFAIHLFREQCFSMSEHLEYYLVEFLKCVNKHCCTNNGREHTRKRRRELKRNDGVRFSFLSWLCTHIAGHPKPLFSINEWNQERNEEKIKNRFRDERWKKVMRILWDKFTEYQQKPNAKQVVKLDRISDKLKEFFLEKVVDKKGIAMVDINGKERYNVDFNKILTMFPNVQEIHYLNQYKFDGKALEKLLKVLDSNKARKGKLALRRLRFLYYDYSETKEVKDEKTGLGIPPEGDSFYSPDQFKRDHLHLMNRLVQAGWACDDEGLVVWGAAKLVDPPSSAQFSAG